MSPLRASLAAFTVSLLVLSTIPVLAERAGRTFESPLNNFTVPVPDLSLFGSDVRVQKRNSKDEGFVSFVGDTGRRRRIDYARLPPNANPLTSDDHHAGYERILKRTIESNARSAVIAQKPHEIEGVPMLLAVVLFPGASALMDARTKEPSDSWRGLLFFIRGRFAYVLYAELTDGGTELRKPPNAEELMKRAEKNLPEFYRTIAFK